MKAAKFDYARVNSIDEALTLLDVNDINVKILAGSQSLGPMLNLRLARPQKLIDISAASALRTVEKQKNSIRIGAAVTHAEIEDGTHDALRGHMMHYVAGRIAYRAVRNRGTIGGSLAHADPAADWVLVCNVLDAQLEIRAGKDARMVPATRYMQAAYTTDLQPEEMIVAVHVPMMSSEARWGYYKFVRKVGEFAEASCACYFDRAASVARIVIGALDGSPQLLPDLSVSAAQYGMAAVTPQAIDQAIAPHIQNKDAAERIWFRTVVERSLRQALGEQGMTNE
ncbi:carbon monoxide dehydrogenase [Advenella sp. S44]|uniref:FAD binding domain-containing protein n=1 Tax=Advenella sp. S44 TaxID=1982755 RepID=UPI000C29A963|nr:FAD binding domain-containing protein [Advenella sp. S44]PJX28106.1 carbon monoxide dehydrogenase [Advenella sp. S44]